MNKNYTILLLEDEPLVLMDLEFAAEDCGCTTFSATSCDVAKRLIGEHSQAIDLAILDVSLGNGETCFPVARELDQHKIPYILHSGDLDRHNERIRELKAELIAKPAAAETVIAAAIIHSQGRTPGAIETAARLR